MKRVLVVVSDEVARQGLCRDVEAAGYKALEAPGGRGAFRQAAMMKPHLILVALPMNDMPLSELKAKLAGAERTAEIPLLALTGDAGALEGVESGLDGVLLQTPSPEQLKAELDRLLVKRADNPDT